jgi:PAS domain S-box-containing protein
VATNEEEERLLRSVALQNAASIQVARQKAEEALVQSNETLQQRTTELAESLSLLRATLEATGDALLVTTSDGRVIDHNEQFVRMWNLPASVVATKNHRKLAETISRQFVNPDKYLARVQEIYDSSGDMWDDLLPVDGRMIERFAKVQYADNRPVGRVWSFRDVTQRRQIDEIRSRLAAIIEYSDDAIVSKTLDGTITSWNDGAFRMFGYSAQEAIGKSITILIPPDRIQEEELIIGKIARGEHVDHYETERLRKDGSRIHVSLTISPLKDSGGSIVGASKIGRDITEKKSSQEQLRRAAEEREQLLRSERAARENAETASRLKDEFLATLSHELRTPLNAILGWAQLLAMGNATAEDFDQGLDAIQRNARVQAQLIEDLLDMSRIISGKVRLDVQWTDLAGVVDAAVDSLRPAAEAKSIRIRKILDPQAGPVSGDPTRLQQVIWNLLSNAIKFTPKNGTVDVLLERVNSHLEITVHDTGIGIAPELLPFVFERFRQADSSTTRAHGGLGLGLSIVKNLVELHGGRVSVKSPGEGQGSTFVVALPVAPMRQGEKREHPSSPVSPTFDCSSLNLAGVTVLVVDDEPDARALIARLLSECKASVLTAGSAAEGLVQLQRAKPDVVVSDIGMPDVDGYELMRQIRSLPEHEGGKTPAIALTAFARSEDRTRAMIAGYNVHISKPIEPSELVATVGGLAGRTGGWQQ